MRPSGSSALRVSQRALGRAFSFPLQHSRLVAGHWKATMRLNIKADPAAAPVATATFNFDFTVTDYDAISIYFPAFDTIAPLVNMDLRYDPIKQMVGGRKQLEMLYDGPARRASSSASPCVTAGRARHPAATRGLAPRWWRRRPPAPGLPRQPELRRARYPHAAWRGRAAAWHRQRRTAPGHAARYQPAGLLRAHAADIADTSHPVASKRPGLYEGELTVELRVPTAKP